MIAAHLSITGRVQGVGFRASLAQQARSRNLAGWVRNRRDGSVEALVLGEASRVDEVVQWARRGPLHATVTDVAVKSGPARATDAPWVFEQRPTE